MLAGMLLGLGIALIGAFFCWALFRGYLKAKETRSWKPVAAIILKSAVREVRPFPEARISYEHDLLYRYDFGGTTRQGSRVKRIEGGSPNRQRIEQRIKSYPVGDQTTCFVNPADGDDVILKHATLAPLYTMWFPGLFVIGGVGIAAGSLFRGLSSKQ